MSSSVWAAALMAASLLAACTPTGPSTSGTRTEWLKACDSSQECVEGTGCHCGVCTAECTSDDDCVAGICSPEPGPPECSADTSLGRICLPISELPFSEPTQIAGLTVAGATEFDDPSFTDDRLELYFSASGAPEGQQIFRTVRADTSAPWEPPTVVAELQHDDGFASMPGVSSDGLTLYYTFTPDAGERVLYVTTRSSRNAAWAPPRPVKFTNDSGIGDSPSASSDGLLLVWGRVEARLTEVLLARRGSVDEPWEYQGVIAEITQPRSGEPWISDDGLTIFYRADFNIHQAFRESRDVPFGAPTIVEELSSSAREFDPWLSQDLRHVMFASNKDGEMMLYESER